MIQIAAWLGTLGGRITLGAGVLMALSGLRWWDVSTQQAKGAVKAVAAIEKANTNASKAGKRAAERSTSAGVRGERDPTTRND